MSEVRRAKLIKRGAGKEEAASPQDVKMSVSEMLRAFDELWRIEHSEDLEKLRAKERKALTLREAIASLEN